MSCQASGTPKTDNEIPSGRCPETDRPDVGLEKGRKMTATMTLFDKKMEKPRIYVEGARIVETPEHPLIARLHVIPEPKPGDKRPKIQGKYISSSQMNKYDYCQAQFMFSYMYGLKEPSNSSLIFGSAIHAAGETYLHARREMRRMGIEFEPLYHHLPFRAQAMHDALFYVRSNVNETIGWNRQYPNGDEETFETLIESVKVGVVMMADQVWIDIDAVAIEQGYVIEWKDPDVFPILGYTDIVERTADGEEQIVDMKTGKEKNEWDAKLDRALSIYCLAREIETGKSVRKVGYKSFVRNKAPKIVTVVTERSDQDLRRLYVQARAFSNIKRNIEEDPIYNVMPKDDSKACPKCYVREHCTKMFGDTSPMNGREAKVFDIPTFEQKV